MLWAIASSAFVIYLYRKLNVTAGTDAAEDVASGNPVDIELAKLNSRIDALESVMGVQARRITP